MTFCRHSCPELFLKELLERLVCHQVMRGPSQACISWVSAGLRGRCDPVCFGPSTLFLQTVLCKPVTRRNPEEVDHLGLVWFFIKWPISLGHLCTVLCRFNGLEGNRINPEVMAAAVFLPLTLSFSSSSSLNNLSIYPFRTTSLSHFDQSL